jgi:hypothetical protein
MHYRAHLICGNLVYSCFSGRGNVNIDIEFIFIRHVSLTGDNPFHGSQKKIFRHILHGAIDYSALEWEHVSSNGQVEHFYRRRKKTEARRQTNPIEYLFMSI